MDIANKYTIYVGTSRGVLQQTKCVPDEKITFSLPEEQSETSAMEWGHSQDEIIVGYKNGQVNVFDTMEERYVRSLKELEGKGAVVGIGVSGDSIIAARYSGIINIWSGKSSDFFSINLEEKGTLDCMVHQSNRPNVVATGGEFNDLKLWDIETKQCLFKAKSMGHDELNLPIPTSVRGITFFREANNLSACATKEGFVLLYDERAQRRPVVKFLEKKASYTCITSAFRDKQCLVGTTRGYVQMLDLKTPGKCMKTFMGFTGSVTDIVCDPVEPLVATTSLDRYLRIHNLDSKELVHKAYLKQNLSKILWKPVVKEESDEDEEKDTNSKDTTEQTSDSGAKLIIDEEYEELFNNMETVDEPEEKKRKLKSKSVKKKKMKKCEVSE